MSETLRNYIESHFSFKPNKNQLRDLERLIFEIKQRENITLEALADYLKKHSAFDKYSGRNRFFAIKNSLIKRRYPLTNSHEKIDTKKIYLPKVRGYLPENWKVSVPFKPLKVFVEKEVRGSYLVDNFRIIFPGVRIEEINLYSDYLKKNKFTLSQLKKPLVFIIKEKWDFLKPCPCTPAHVGCGYWILNLGFGCPFDCSYCFLQCYANFPGIMLPANLDDFFAQFDKFYKKLRHPIRIGTGEFCDSLALDTITGYTKALIPYFRDKRVLFELKTKSACIENILNIEASPNIIISWSLNPQEIIAKEEHATATLAQRLEAARRVQEKGYGIAFHFDPIIHCEGWQDLYKEVIEEIYRAVKPPFAWISLGTLRSHRDLKTIVEQRFTQSSIFRGELLLGDDKKLRYPKFLREEIYSNMTAWLRKHEEQTPLYLCMEDSSMWKILGNNLDCAKKVEHYLLESNVNNVF
jgi:spore photoproduct lyase